MKRKVFVSKELAGTPLIELGGVVLQEGQELVASETLGAMLKLHYGKKLIEVGTIEKDFLSNGDYEINKKSAVIQDEVSSSNFQDVSTNRSLAGKKLGKKQ
jgi:hypothetical protein